MKYFVIYNGDGDTSVREFTKDELLEELDDGAWGNATPLEMLTNSDTNYWGDNFLIIKGEIVTPKKKEVVTKFDLP
jgi:hypothetical protein